MAEEKYDRKWHEGYDPKADKKKYFLTDVIDYIDDTGGTALKNWWEDERKLEGWEHLNPISISTFGATRAVEGVGWVLTNTPGVKQAVGGLARAEDIAAGTAGDLVGLANIDPRVGGWGVRAATALYGGPAIAKGVTKAAKATGLTAKVSKGVSRFTGALDKTAGEYAQRVRARKGHKWTRPGDKGTPIDRSNVWDPDDLTGPQKTYTRLIDQIDNPLYRNVDDLSLVDEVLAAGDDVIYPPGSQEARIQAQYQAMAPRKNVNNPDQLELFPDPLRKIVPQRSPRFPFGESIDELAKKGFNPVTIQSLRDAGVSENLIFTMKNWNVTGKQLGSGPSRAAAAAVERPAFSEALFELRRLKLLPIFEQGFINAGTTLKPKLHHIAGLKASLPLYDGIKIGKEAYNKLNKLLQEQDIFPGHHMKNFMMLSDESHLAIHRFLDDVIGPSGEIFFNAERKARIRKSDIHEQYIKLYGKAPNDPETLIRIMEEAEALYEKIGPRYSNRSLRKIIEDVEGFSQKQLIDDAFEYQMKQANIEEIAETGKSLPGMVSPKVDRIFEGPKNPKKKLK